METETRDLVDQEEMETDSRTGSPVRVEETRRRVEKLAVDEGSQASELLRTVTERAKDGWGKIRKVLEGKRLVWKGNTGKMVLVGGEKEVGEGGDGVASLEEEMIGGTVEIVEESRMDGQNRRQRYRSTKNDR
jgi:hypothetical protein